MSNVRDGDVGARPVGQSAPARVVRSGRSLITRAELSRLCGLSSGALGSLYSQRANNGHPPAVETDPVRGTLYFDEEQALRWHYTRRRVNPPRRPRHLDLSGDPDDLITMTEAARILGYHGPATIRSYRARFAGYFPPPDHIHRTPSGRERKTWRRASIWAFGNRRAHPSPELP